MAPEGSRGSKTSLGKESLESVSEESKANGGTLGACRQKEYLVMMLAPRGNIKGVSCFRKFFLTACIVCEWWCACAWFSSISSFMKGALGVL